MVYRVEQKCPKGLGGGGGGELCGWLGVDVICPLNCISLCHMQLVVFLANGFDLSCAWLQLPLMGYKCVQVGLLFVT